MFQHNKWMRWRFRCMYLKFLFVHHVALVTKKHPVFTNLLFILGLWLACCYGVYLLHSYTFPFLAGVLQ